MQKSTEKAWLNCNKSFINLNETFIIAFNAKLKTRFPENDT